LSQGRPLVNNLSNIDLNIISVEHYLNHGVYGTLRLKHLIQNKYGIIFNHKKIRRYKTIFNLITVTRKKRPLFFRTQKERSHSYMASNLLKNNFTSNQPFEKLSTDVSYIKCTDGLLYLSVVKDLFNNQIISYSISNKNDVDLIMQTLNNLPQSNGIMHSDQGSLYYARSYITKLEKLGYVRSMSRKGCCWENSPVENWFSQLKEEHLRRIGKKSKKETKLEIKKYVQCCTTERIQKDLGYLSPINFLNNI